MNGIFSDSTRFDLKLWFMHGHFWLICYACFPDVCVLSFLFVYAIVGVSSHFFFFLSLCLCGIYLCVLLHWPVKNMKYVVTHLNNKHLSTVVMTTRRLFRCSLKCSLRRLLMFKHIEHHFTVTMIRIEYTISLSANAMSSMVSFIHSVSFSVFFFFHFEVAAASAVAVVVMPFIFRLSNAPEWLFVFENTNNYVPNVWISFYGMDFYH